MNKENGLWLRFETFFLFMDLKVILLIFMLFRFYKETVLLADVAKTNLKMNVVELLNLTWQSAGEGMWKWIIAAIIGDIFIKKMLNSINE